MALYSPVRPARGGGDPVDLDETGHTDEPWIPEWLPSGMDIADDSAESARCDARVFRVRMRRVWLVPASETLAGLTSVWCVSSYAPDWTVWSAAGAGAGYAAAAVWAAWQAHWLVSRRRAEQVIDRARTGRRLARLEALAADGYKALVRTRESVGRGVRFDQPPGGGVPACPPGPFGDVEHALRRLTAEALDVAAEDGDQQQVDVLVHIARRLAALVSRALRELRDQQLEVEDPILLDGLWRLDNLVTRVRRQVESLAVLGGAVPRRMTEPSPLSSVLRQAIAEVEQYPRVRVPILPEGAVVGYAVVEVTHLLAELMENATKFSPPDTQVLVRAAPVPAGLAVEIEDRGLTIAPADLQAMNTLLVSPELSDARQQIAAGQIGLYVVARIAARRGIHVELATNKYGGTQAIVIVPDRLLSTAPAEGIPAPGPQVEAHGLNVPRPAAPAVAHGGLTAGFPSRVAPGVPAPDVLRPKSDRGIRSIPAFQEAQDCPPARPTAGGDGRPSLPQRRIPPRGPVPAAGEHERPRDSGAPDPGLMARYSHGVQRGTRDLGEPDLTTP